MLNSAERNIISPDNIDAIRQHLPTDQADALKPGCITWPIQPIAHEAAGRITVWPEDQRAAVVYGAGGSTWGTWNAQENTIALDDQNMTIDEQGQIIQRPTVAVSLTQDQVRLLLSSEYPQDGQKQNTALDEIFAGNPISIENESVLLAYSEDSKTFFAKLDANEKPQLDAKLTQLQLDKERDKFQPNNRQAERDITHSIQRNRQHER